MNFLLMQEQFSIILKIVVENYSSWRQDACMIPFEEIDARLGQIGKDRKWLAEATNRSQDSIRTALAPNAADYKRSERLQRDLSQAIEAEELRQKNTLRPLLQNFVLEVGQEQFDRWNAAALGEGKLIRQWALDGLDALAADELLRASATAPLPATGTEGK